MLTFFHLGVIDQEKIDKRKLVGKKTPRLALENPK